MMSLASPVTNNLVGLSELAAASVPLADAALFENLLMGSSLVMTLDGAAEPTSSAQPELAVEAGDQDPVLPDALLALLASPLPPAPHPIRAAKAHDAALPAIASNAGSTAEGPATLAQLPGPPLAPDTTLPNPNGSASLTNPAAQQTTPLIASTTTAAALIAHRPDAPCAPPAAPAAPSAMIRLASDPRLVVHRPDAPSAPPAAPPTESSLAPALPPTVAPAQAAATPTLSAEQAEVANAAMPLPQSPVAKLITDTQSFEAQTSDPGTFAASAATPAPEKIAKISIAPANPAFDVDKGAPEAALSQEEQMSSAPPRDMRPIQPGAPKIPDASLPTIPSDPADSSMRMQPPVDIGPTHLRGDLPSSARVTLPLSPTQDAEPTKVEILDSSASPLVLTSLAAPAARPITAADGNVVLAEASAAPLDLSPDLAFLDRLSAEISDMAREGGKLHFRLTPAHLGRLDIAVEAQGDTVSVHMQTQSPEAKSILTDAQSGLTQDLAARGLRLTETTVTLAGDGSLPRRNQQMPAATIETETPSEADTGSPIMARQSGRFA